MFNMTALFILAALGTGGSTWSEPWHEDVISNSQTFVRARVLETHGRQGATFRLEKLLAGANVTPVFSVNGFSMVRYMSYSTGSGARLSVFKGESYYLFMQWNQQARDWQLATPRSGCDAVLKNGVSATFRRSISKALFDEETYEQVQTALFEKIHQRSFDGTKTRNYIKKWLSQAPVTAPMPGVENKASKFYNQHAAMELMRQFAIASDLELLKPFLKQKDFHIAMSAVRALAKIPGRIAESELAQFAVRDGEGAPRNLAVYALGKRNASHARPILEKWLKLGKNQSAGLGLDIMDPRIATSAGGYVRTEILRLLKHWDSKK